MNLLNVPKLRNKQLQSLTEQSLKICSDIEVLKPSCTQVKNRLNTFIGGMLKSKTSAEQKRIFDNERDELCKGLFREIAAETYYPHTKAEAVSIVKSLTQINQKYGLSISNLSYNEQTAATDNLIADLKQIDFSMLRGSGINRWIPLIEKANNDFKAAANNYISSEAKSGDIESATNVVPELTESLEAMYAMLFAYGKINPDEKITNAYNELELLIDSYR